jgi:hypothetical protein
VEKIEDNISLKIEGLPWTGDDDKDGSTAEDELSQINGIAKLLRPNFRPVTIARVAVKDPPTGKMTSTQRVRCVGESRSKGSAKVQASPNPRWAGALTPKERGPFIIQTRSVPTLIDMANGKAPETPEFLSGYGETQGKQLELPRFRCWNKVIRMPKSRRLRSN